jgi:hypothetical protein
VTGQDKHNIAAGIQDITINTHPDGLSASAYVNTADFFCRISGPRRFLQTCGSGPALQKPTSRHNICAYAIGSPWAGMRCLTKEVDWEEHKSIRPFAYLYNQIEGNYFEFV